MFRNYLLSSLRSLRKNFAYSIINIAGLGLGLATFLLLTTWVVDEWSYDKFHDKAQRIYRPSLEYSFGGQTAKTSVSPTAVLPTLKKNFAEVEEGVRVFNAGHSRGVVLRVNDRLFQETKFYYADSTFFKVFSFPLLEGNEDKALTAPQSLVLTRAMAQKYFGSENPIGQTINVNNHTDFVVTGVIENIPANSLLQPDVIASFSTLDESRQESWWSANYQTFVLLSPNAAIHSLEEKFNNLLTKQPEIELPNQGDYVRYNFIPLTDIYLHSTMMESEKVGNIQYIYIFGSVALLVLIIAGINYINLATAKAADRAKEVGVRKVVGALRNQLFFQFISESLLITASSFIVAIFLASLALPFFNTLTGKTFDLGAFFNIKFALFTGALLILLALTAGAYPALAITAFKPVSVLKGNFKTSARGIWLRKSLVVVQFSISIVLMVSASVILKQLNFIQNKTLGFEKENVVVIPLDRSSHQLFDAFKSELIKNQIVDEVGRAGESPTKINGGYSLSVQGTSDVRPMIVTAMPIDKDFVSAVKMKVIAGRNFTESDFKHYETDTITSFLVNESALKQLSLDPEKAVGMNVNLNGREGKITGIVGNFHFSSLHEPIRPLVMFTENEQLRFMFLRFRAGNVTASIKKLETTFKELFPHRPFEFTFLNDQYTHLYEKESRMGNISIIFSLLAIIIACLGLVGLVTFAAAQKTKEIGIRKVLGASASSIVVLITKDFTQLVLIAILLGLPLSYWIMDSLWLSSFAYRTEVGLIPLLAAALACLLVAWGASGYQAIKAAGADPSLSLRSE